MTQTTLTRRYRWMDHFLIRAQKGLHLIHQLQKPSTMSIRANPSEGLTDTLSKQEKKQSACLMRINHTGEVCAQALYLGQSLSTRNLHLQTLFADAAKEEFDHLHWCQERLIELESRTSYLNPLWFTGSLLIGMSMGRLGNRWSLGFLAETEHQVTRHLSAHLALLGRDQKSCAILTQMQIDETKHATTAESYGAAILPYPIQIGMRGMAKVMTTVTYFV